MKEETALMCGKKTNENKQNDKNKSEGICRSSL